MGWMLALRAPVAFLELLLAYLGFERMYHTVTSMEGPVWGLVLQALSTEVSPDDIRYLLQGLPPVPGLARVLPWLLLAAPLYVLSLWLHDAVWDHGCLWLLGGLKGKRGFNTTLVAEAEALQVGVIGALLALLTSLPRIGWLLSLPIGIVAVYFWLLRGVALAAFHQCTTWKGVAATVLHAALVACFAFGMLLLLFVLLTQVLA
jgi:hypothetical protein